MKGTFVFSQASLLMVCLASTVTAWSSYTGTLFSRDSTCPDPSQNHCSSPGLPLNFCCPPDSICLPLAANTTLLCCKGSNVTDCSSIHTIDCDIAFQNVTRFSANTLKTTALDVPLPKCGTKCCPHGFSCTSKGDCEINSDQSKKPVKSADATSTTAATSASTDPASTSTASQNSSLGLPVTESCNKFPAPAVLVGFFPGLALGILLAVAGMLICGRRKEKNRRSGSSFGNISEPQPLQPNDGGRTEFLRKPPQTPSSTAASTPGQSRRSMIEKRVKSMLNGQTPSPMRDPRYNPQPLNIPNRAPVTPPLQRDNSLHGDIPIGREPTRRTPPPRAGGLMPAAKDWSDRDRDSIMSQETTITNFMGPRPGPAGLVPGRKFEYQGNTPRYGSPR